MDETYSEVLGEIDARCKSQPKDRFFSASFTGCCLGVALKNYPAAPTMAESGVADFVSDAWFGAYLPTKTPPAMVRRLNTAFNRALRDPAVIGRLDQLGLKAAGGSPEALESAQRTDIERWARVVKAARLKLDE